MFFKSKEAESQDMATPEQIAAIFELMKKLSAGDLSILEPVSKNTEDRIFTHAGSPNDQLWSAMEKVHWAAHELAPAELSGPNNAQAKIFRILEAGKEPISRLLKDLLEESTRKPSGPRVEGVDLGNDFILRLRQAIIDNGGKMLDFSTVMAFTVAKAAHSYVAPENKQAWIDEISKIAKSLIEKMEKNDADHSSR